MILFLCFTEYLEGGTAADFERLPFSRMLPIGAWPFSCQKLIPCQETPHQTCGCLNTADSEQFAIVYNLKNPSKQNYLKADNIQC